MSESASQRVNESENAPGEGGRAYRARVSQSAEAQAEEYRQKNREEMSPLSSRVSTLSDLNGQRSPACPATVGSVEWVGGRSFDWRNILWREWRHTEDEEYARHLFDLVADELVGREATLVTGVMGALYGGLAGWLINLISSLGQSAGTSQTSWSGLIWIGVLLGGVGGLLVRLLLEQRLSWRAWLARLSLHMTPNELGPLGLGLLFVLVGGLVGWSVGWLVGLGHVVGTVMLGILLVGGLGASVVGWLVGLEREPNPTHLHRYRAGWFWWRGRPRRVEVEAALKQACATLPAAPAVWAEALQNLERGQEQPDSPQKLMSQLQSRDWLERFTAAHLLPALGGEAVAHLQPIAARRSSPLWRKALGLLQSIAQETTGRLAPRAAKLLCPHCLTRFGAHSVAVSEDKTFTYYGCRTCGQSRQFLEGDVVALLDAATTAEPVQQDGVVRVNWLPRRTLFDFDRIEIIQATDEAVERFAVQVGNDTDPFRKPHYQQMQCVVAPACELSENTWRILNRIFGQVERMGE